MTELLEKAFAEAAKLPEPEQDLVLDPHAEYDELLRRL